MATEAIFCYVFLALFSGQIFFAAADGDSSFGSAKSEAEDARRTLMVAQATLL
jgi:hypothetical protein